MPWFRRIIVRRATHGTGKISVGGINQMFKLESEAGYVDLHDHVETLIKAELRAELTSFFEQASNDSWAPKLPFTSPKKPATPITPQLFHPHLEDFTLFFQVKVVPLTQWNTDLAYQQAQEILTQACQMQILLLRNATSVNQAGIINFY